LSILWHPQESEVIPALSGVLACRRGSIKLAGRMIKCQGLSELCTLKLEWGQQKG
ncbi:hypothetical protein STEG23_017619, partial [Scotinomys teguina]